MPTRLATTIPSIRHRCWHERSGSAALLHTACTRWLGALAFALGLWIVLVLVVLICCATVSACSCVAQLRARAAIPPTLQNEQQLRLHCTFHKPAVLPCTTVFASYPSTTVRGAASAPQATVANGVLTAGDGWDTSNGVLPALPGLVTCTAFDLRSAKRTSDVHMRGGVALSGV